MDENTTRPTRRMIHNYEYSSITVEFTCGGLRWHRFGKVAKRADNGIAPLDAAQPTVRRNDVLYGQRFGSTRSAVAHPLRKSLPDPGHSLRVDRSHPSLQHFTFHDRQAADPDHARHLQS